MKTEKKNFKSYVFKGRLSRKFKKVNDIQERKNGGHRNVKKIVIS